MIGIMTNHKILLLDILYTNEGSGETWMGTVSKSEWKLDAFKRVGVDSITFV